MKDRHLEERPACSVKSTPVPVEITCNICGTEAEIWSDETDIVCNSCGCMIKKTKTNN